MNRKCSISMLMHFYLLASFANGLSYLIYVYNLKCKNYNVFLLKLRKEKTFFVRITFFCIFNAKCPFFPYSLYDFITYLPWTPFRGYYPVRMFFFKFYISLALHNNYLMASGVLFIKKLDLIKIASHGLYLRIEDYFIATMYRDDDDDMLYTCLIMIHSCIKKMIFENIYWWLQFGFSFLPNREIIHLDFYPIWK